VKTSVSGRETSIKEVPQKKKKSHVRVRDIDMGERKGYVIRMDKTISSAVPEVRQGFDLLSAKGKGTRQG